MNEKEVQQQITQQFIDSDPTAITLIPHTRVKQSNGGWRADAGTPRASQTFKLSPLTSALRPTVVIDGVERVADYMLIGPVDAVVQVGDTWTADDGRSFEVIRIEDGHGYETLALAAAHG